MIQEASRIRPESYVNVVSETAHFIMEQFAERIPTIGLIVGEEINFIEDHFNVDDAWIPEKFIPLEGYMSDGFPFVGKIDLGGATALIAKGLPYVKGKRSMQQVALSVRVMGLIGMHGLIVLNTATSLHAEIKPGDTCLLSDHINFLSTSPLVGHNIDDWGPRFPDMTEPYDVALREQCVEFAEAEGISLRERVLVAISSSERNKVNDGGNRYLRELGADIVGYDTVPEVIAARHMDMKVVGISCVNEVAPKPGSGDATQDEGQSQSRVVTLLNAIASFI